ncbi:AbrB/MazE/SpoVT family DNA-binding domain-containing protein [Candidatus Micrarchaeota archaeon]|nr:AbrB/MazE/SpoVT family DNA-binding domain-containing protein [Candidatus Micrarchaeota archaeon]
MEVVRVSPKYQVVIPKKIRESLNVRKGETMEITLEKGKIVLNRIPPIEEFFGKFPGLKERSPTIRELRREADAKLDRR